MANANNRLYVGDNLEVMRRSLDQGTVALAYVDPPFGTAASFLTESERDTDAYVEFLRPRLIEIRRTLNQSGSIFVHSSPEGAHHVRRLLDEIFGESAFCNEIVWAYARSTTSQGRMLPSQHELIYWYARTPGLQKFNLDRLLAVLENQQRRSAVGDVWTISAKEFTSDRYLPSQKPLELLERIIVLATDAGDLVLDPFLGSGGSAAVAQRLERRWVGIELEQQVVEIARRRLIDELGPDVAHTYRVVGIPQTEGDVRELAANDPLEFERWAVGLLGARPRGFTQADRGADAVITIGNPSASGRMRRLVIEVKARAFRSSDLDQLKKVASWEDADAAVLIVVDVPDPRVNREAIDRGGFISSTSGAPIPRFQVFGAVDLVRGARPQMPDEPNPGILDA